MSENVVTAVDAVVTPLPAFQRLDDAEPAYLLRVVVVDARIVPGDAAIGDLALLGVEQAGNGLEGAAVLLILLLSF